HLVRTVPGGGRIIWNATDERLRETLAMGCWTPLEGFAGRPVPESLWTARAAGGVEDFSCFEVLEQGRPRGTVQWGLIGAHNMENALAAIAAARRIGANRRRPGAAFQHDAHGRTPRIARGIPGGGG